MTVNALEYFSAHKIDMWGAQITIPRFSLVYSNFCFQLAEDVSIWVWNMLQIIKTIYEVDLESFLLFIENFTSFRAMDLYNNISLHYLGY